MISPDVIELIARWEVPDLTDVPYGGSQAMQEVSYVPYSNKGLILADLIVRGVEAGLRPADSYVRDFACREVRDFWDGTVRFLKASI